MKTLRLVLERPEAAVEKLRKQHPTRNHYHTVITDDALVLKPNGDFLLRYVPNHAQEAALRLRVADCDRLFNSLKPVGRRADNSNRAAVNHAIGGRDGVIGFADRVPTFRQSQCRMTELTREHLDTYISVLPFAQRVDALYRRYVPELYAAQAKVVRETHPEWVIPGTVFTSWTLNLTVDTTLHTDEGDLPEGCSVLTVVWKGEPNGCYLVFPKYMIAVQMRTGDVLFMDSHAMHGNTRFTGKRGTFERLANVFYYRTNMQRCGTLPEENEWAASGGSP